MLLPRYQYYYNVFFRSIPAPYTHTCAHTLKQASKQTHQHNAFFPFLFSFYLFPTLFFFFILCFTCLAFIIVVIELNMYIEAGKKVILQIVYRCLLFQSIEFRSKSVVELSAHEIQVNETDFIESHMGKKERITHKKETYTNNNKTNNSDKNNSVTCNYK